MAWGKFQSLGNDVELGRMERTEVNRMLEWRTFLYGTGCLLCELLSSLGYANMMRSLSKRAFVSNEDASRGTGCSAAAMRS